MSFDGLFEDRFAWRDYCEDGWEFGLDPEDYETEEEYEEALEEAKHAWREDCEDGSEFGLDPEDYETEEEYEEALEEAKYAWREDCEDGWEFGLDPEDYETEEEYEQALEQARGQDGLSGAIELTLPFEARNKVHRTGEKEDLDAEIARAASAYFGLPSLRPRGIRDIIEQVMEDNIPRAVEIWRWCVKNYTPRADGDVIHQDIFLHCKLYPRAFWERVEVAIARHPDFCTGLFRDAPCEPLEAVVMMLAEIAMERDEPAVARDVTLASLANPHLAADDGKRLVDFIISTCCSGKDRDTVRRFREEVYPAIRSFCESRFPDELAGWDKTIAIYTEFAREPAPKPKVRDAVPNTANGVQDRAGAMQAVSAVLSEVLEQRLAEESSKAKDIPGSAAVREEMEAPAPVPLEPEKTQRLAEGKNSAELIPADAAVREEIEPPSPVPPGPKRPRMDCVRKRRIGLWLCAAMVLTGAAVFIRQYNQKVEDLARLACEQQAAAFCEQYGLEDVSAKAVMDRDMRPRVCRISVTARGISALSYEQRYELVQQLEAIQIEDPAMSETYTELLFDGEEYRIDPDDAYTLLVGEDQSYVEEKEAERRFLQELGRKSVYEGLPEEYINKTVLGRPDHVEKPDDPEAVPAEERTVIYTWDYRNGAPMVQAAVGYWDEDAGTETDGFVKAVVRFDPPAPTPTPKPRYVYTVPKKPKATAKPDDPYDVYDYYDPDDFYFDHPDDFFDYYDAEDYFYDHVD